MTPLGFARPWWELTFNKESKLKELQEICKNLGLPSSGSKVKVLKRLKQYKHHEEEKIAYEVAHVFSVSNAEKKFQSEHPSCQPSMSKSFTSSPTCHSRHGVNIVWQQGQKKM